jgi:hypothetical protein
VLVRRATGEIAVAGTSPLHYACSRFGTEYLPIVALLLRCGASTLAVDTSGSTACDVASNPVTSAMVCAHAYRLSGSISASSSAHNSAYRGRHSASASGAGDAATGAHSHSSHSNYSGGAAAAAAGAQQAQLGIGAYRTAKEVNWSLQAATCHWDGCGSYELWRYIVRCAAVVRCAANTAALAAKDSSKQRSKRLSKHARELLIMQSERLAGARAHCEELSNSSSASSATSTMARCYATSTRDSVSTSTSATAAGSTSGDRQSAVAATEKLVGQLERAVHAAQHRAPNKLEEVMMSALTDSRRAKAVHWWCATADDSTRSSAAAAAHAGSISSSRTRDSAAVAAAVAAAVESDSFAAAAAAAAEAAVRSLSGTTTTATTNNNSVSGYATGSSVSISTPAHTTDTTTADTSADGSTTRGSTGGSSGKVKRRTWWPTVPLENAPAPPPLVLDVVPHTPQRRSYAATAQLRCTRDLAAVEAAVATVMTWSPRVILDLIVPAGWGSDSGESAWCSLKSERASLDARKAALVAAASDTEQRYKMVTGALLSYVKLCYHLKPFSKAVYNQCIH